MDNYAKKAKVVHCGKPQNDRFQHEIQPTLLDNCRISEWLNTIVACWSVVKVHWIVIFPESGFIGSTGVIGYINSEYKIVDNSKPQHTVEPR